MSLNNLQLPAFVLGDLFRHSLVDLTGTAKQQSVTSTTELNFFGGNKQHILLLVNTPDTAFITDQQLTFLSGILTACKLTLEDVGIVNIASYPGITYKKISETFHPRIVMMFGVSPKEVQLPFIIPEFQNQSYDNQVYLSVPSLNELQNDKELKRKLWLLLQQTFSL